MQVIPFIYDNKDEIIANCYLVIDTKKKCVIIDPSVDYDGIISFIHKNELLPCGILLTHSHFDHMRGVNRLVNEFHIPLFVHSDDVSGLTDSYLNCSDGFNGEKIIINSDYQVVEDGDKLDLLEKPIAVIHTPYHTKGSVCYYIEDAQILFSGDTLFKMTIGRSDLPSSSPSMRQTTFAKIMKLPDEVKVYPGHGRFTSIGDERRLNAFVKR